MKYKYTKEDVDFLRTHYPIGDWDSIQNRFPTLSKSAIHKKCFRSGISFNNEHRKEFKKSTTRRRWSPDEIEILKQHYSNTPLKDIQNLLPGRTLDTIKSKASALHLKSMYKIEQSWKDDEVKYIRDHWEITPDIIMAGVLGRTFRAVKAKREEIGCFRQDMDSYSYPTLSKYLRGNNQQWKKDSMKNCDYKCVLTGSKDFEIHHLYGVSNIINDLFDKYPCYKDKPFSDLSDDDLSFLLHEFLIEQSKYPLGVCVEKRIHVLFHSLYGQYYNTPEQWNKFCTDYKNGIYKEYV